MSVFDESEYAAEEIVNSFIGTEPDGEAILEEENQNATEILNEAIARIEEANLYKELVSAEIFGKGSARESIRLIVNEKIKKFAINELETLLGMKSSTKVAEVVSQFSEEEVMRLKNLATIDNRQKLAIEILANQVLKKDMVPKEPVATVEVVYKPSIKAIAATQSAPAVTKAQVSPVVQAKPKAPAPAPKKNSKSMLKGNYASLATPNGSTKSIPTPRNAEDLIRSGAIRAPGAQVTMASSPGSTGFIQGIVSQLTGGNIVTQAGGPSDSDSDINDRL